MDIFAETLDQKKIIAKNSLAICLYDTKYSIYYRTDGFIKNIKFRSKIPANEIQLIGINICSDNHILNYDDLEFLEITYRKGEFIFLKSCINKNYICTDYTTPQIILDNRDIDCMMDFIKLTKNRNITISKYVNRLKYKKVLNTSAKTILTGDFSDIVYVHYVDNNKLVNVCVPIFDKKFICRLFGHVVIYKHNDSEYIYDNDRGELRDIIVAQKPKYIVTRFHKSNIYMKNCRPSNPKSVNSDSAKYRSSSLWKVHYPNGEIFAFTYYNMPVAVIKFISCYDDFILVFFEETAQKDSAFTIMI